MACIIPSRDTKHLLFKVRGNPEWEPENSLLQSEQSGLTVLRRFILNPKKQRGEFVLLRIRLFFVYNSTHREGQALHYVTSQRFLSVHQRPREEIGQDGLQPGIIDDNGVI